MNKKPRLEKVDRNRVKESIEKLGGYVRTNFGGPFTGKTGRPDLQGVAFVIEMKREDEQQPWNGCTDKQKKDLIAFAKGGGRACAAVVKKCESWKNGACDKACKGWHVYFHIVNWDDVTKSEMVIVSSATLEQFAVKILTGIGWPSNEPSLN